MKEIAQTKSYTSIYEIFGSAPFSNVLYKKPIKTENDHVLCTATCGDLRKNVEIKCHPKYITSEGYHGLNKISSKKSMVRSTSTIFYDLDEVAKRHSLHCLKENVLSNSNNILKVVKSPTNKHKLGGKSETIVQDCAMQVQPNFQVYDNLDLKTEKTTKRNVTDEVLSSEIFLRDDEQLCNQFKTQCYYEDNTPNRNQKFWSYTKYRTEKSDEVSEEKKSKKKDRGKRIEDPCPCQLFSYACPCTNKKSLTELARNSKSLTVADNITSTTNIFRTEQRSSNTKKKNKHKMINNDKSNTRGNINDNDIPTNDDITELMNRNDLNLILDKPTDKSHKKSKSSNKKVRKLICPKCREKVEVISVTEDENARSSSLIYHSKEISSTTAYAYRASPTAQGSRIGNDDICKHEPRCELVPVCQILPCDEYDCEQHKYSKQSAIAKSTARVLRITKACRHHPPCTVVPSCQRATVLKNNCEFIPPCLHRPRCINLPLCVPLPKSPHHEEYLSKPTEDDNINYPNYSRCTYIPMCQHNSHNVDKQIHMVSRLKNQCEFMTGIQQAPTYLIEPHPQCISNNVLSSCKKSRVPCSCKSNKSCQYNCIECKCRNSHLPPKKNLSNETVVFIRDVGCQFRNKTYSPIDSVIRSKSSSASFDYVKMGDYCTNIHTLRYEDKFTSPISRIDLSMSSGSSSDEISPGCPSNGIHGEQSTREIEKTGFNPNATYITAYNTQIQPHSGGIFHTYSSKYRDWLYPSQTNKSRKSFSQNKTKRMFAVKTRRKYRTSKHAICCQSKKTVYPEQKRS